MNLEIDPIGRGTSRFTNVPLYRLHPILILLECSPHTRG